MKKESYSKKTLPVIRRVREMLLPHYGNIPFTEKNPNGKENVLTELDLSVENFLREEFKNIYPDISFVGEEYGGDRAAKKFWLVDPIDGTAHFMRGLPFCSTLVALIENGEVIFSAVYDFVNDTMYHAEKDGGAYKEGESISVSTRPFRVSRIEVSIELNEPARLQKFIELKNGCHIFHVGASGIELAMVASGKLDGSIHLGPGSKDYDVTAGLLLIKEAGGVVKNIGKQTYDYRNIDFIATNPIIFKELTEGRNAIFPIKV